MSVMRLCALLVVAACAGLGAGRAGESAQVGSIAPAAANGVYVWSSHRLLTSDADQSALIDASKEFDVGVIYLYATATEYTEYAGPLRNFIRRMSASRLKVYALDGARTYFSDMEGPGLLYAGIRHMIAYNATAAPLERFAGFITDLEPQDGQKGGGPNHFHNGVADAELDPAAAAERAALMADWLSIQRAAAGMLRAANLTLGAALPAWLDDYEGGPVMVGRGAERQSVMAAMMNIVDHYHVMSYHTDPTRNIARAAGAIAHADTVGKSGFIHTGVETGHGIGAKVSYADTPGKQTAAAVLADMTIMAQELRRHPSFAGIDIHDWAGLRGLRRP